MPPACAAFLKADGYDGDDYYVNDDASPMACVHTLPAPGGCLAAWTPPVTHFSCSDSSSNSNTNSSTGVRTQTLPPPHYFVAATSAADQRSNELQILNYFEETCDVECSTRIHHPPEVHALALLPSVPFFSEEVCSRFGSNNSLAEATGAGNSATGEAPAARAAAEAAEASAPATADAAERGGGAAAAYDNSSTSQRDKSTRAHVPLFFVTAFPDPAARYARDRCVAWRCNVEVSTACGSDAALEEEEGAGLRPASPAAPAAVEPLKVGELRSSRPFNSIHRLVARESNCATEGSTSAAAEHALVAVVTDENCSIFRPAAASFEEVCCVSSSCGAALRSAAWDPHHMHVVAAVESMRDSLGGGFSHCSGGLLRLFDLRVSSSSNSSTAAVVPHTCSTATRGAGAATGAGAASASSSSATGSFSSFSPPFSSSSTSLRLGVPVSSVTGTGGCTALRLPRADGLAAAAVSARATAAAAACFNPHGCFAAPLDVHYNPNMPFSLVTGSSDGSAAYWDQRRLEKPIQVLRDIHCHWVTCVRFNGFHDQLLLSASTDNTVKLHCVEDIAGSSSGCCGTGGRGGAGGAAGTLRSSSSDEATEQEQQGGPGGPELVFSYDGSEDSVAAAAWAADDAWTFAALYADGRVSFHQVPSKVKYRILL